MRALVLALLIASAQAEPLPALHAARDGVTASGVSSGGYMAVQLHVAHSANVAGVGVIAGGPYYCAQGSLFTALNNCMTPGVWTPAPQPLLLKREANLLAASGRVDATKNLSRSRVWLFTGTRDRIVYAQVVTALRAFYAEYRATIALVADKPAGHGMVTEQHGHACGTTQPPFIIDCDYDAAGELLNFLYGELGAPAAKESGRLLRFDQTRYAGGDARAISMDESGFAYVPQRCASERCRVHVVFHGCRQGAAEIGERFVREAGYNRWADTNRLIVLYPQAAARSGWSFSGWNFVWNPRGCWDWWGYTGPGYHTQQGAQIRAVKAMLEKLSAQR
jgi:poly(3-hydroxybutyrate) depolymerase